MVLNKEGETEPLEGYLFVWYYKRHALSNRLLTPDEIVLGLWYELAKLFFNTVHPGRIRQYFHTLRGSKSFIGHVPDDQDFYGLPFEDLSVILLSVLGPKGIRPPNSRDEAVHVIIKRHVIGMLSHKHVAHNHLRLLLQDLIRYYDFWGEGAGISGRWHDVSTLYAIGETELNYIAHLEPMVFTSSTYRRLNRKIVHAAEAWASKWVSENSYAYPSFPKRPSN
ncbi:hypothetical protein ABI_28100 [Asticcacaulis biprosthecium C19]|uniref:Uncharacterized protein n=1 Tax=Asticcacaulis biprosthecium C19 TaxID=715226 RepID=F4QMF3_9CAUL|nr:hypothetical protein [Asticcacaulis biprosthecium]EGF91394.1 hypothetical protein ABI_28100 [Asticcacaulis biprosthecium C19]